MTRIAIWLLGGVLMIGGSAWGIADGYTWLVAVVMGTNLVVTNKLISELESMGRKR